MIPRIEDAAPRRTPAGLARPMLILMMRRIVLGKMRPKMSGI